MAARHDPRCDAATRERIRTTQLVAKLQAFVLGEDDPQTGKPVVMSRERVSSSLGLLRKTLPDLAAVELSAAPGTTGRFVIFGEREAPDAAEWRDRHAPPGMDGP